MSSDEDFPLPNNSLNSHLQALSNADVSTHEIEDMNQGVEALLAPYQNKVYMSGFLQMQNLLLPDGLPYQANQWSKWYVELVGSILQFYPVSSPDDCEGAKLDLIKKQEPNPMFLADASVSILKASPDSGHPYVFDLNTQGANKFLLSCLTEDELSIWCLAIRLSNWEYTRIMEYFTALWFDLPQYKPFLDNDYSSQVSYPSAFIRKSGSDDWARLNYQPQQERTKVPAHPKRILLTPGSSKNASDNVQGYEIQSLDHIYLVYPEPEVDDQPSHLVTLIKLEGDITDLSTQRKLPFILIDADSIEVSTNIILSAIDLFGLYRRPNLIEYWFPQIPNPSELGLLLDDIVTLTITDKVDFETKRDFDAVLSYKYGLNQPRTPLHDVEQTFQLQIEAEQEKMRQEKLKEQKEIENQMTFGSRSRGRGSRGSIPFSTEDTPKEQARKTSVSFQEQPHFIPHSGNNSVISEELIQEPRSVSKPSNDDDDDSSEDDIPTLRKTRATRPNQRKPNTSRPQQLDSESDDDDDEGQNWAPIGRNKAANSSQDNVESLNKAMGNLSIPGVQANRSASAMGANQQLKPNQAPRPFTMFKSPSVEAVQKPSSSETSPNTSILPGGSTGMRVPRGPKSRANLPSPSDSEDDEDDTPLNQRISGVGYQQEQPQLQPYDPRFDHQVHRYPQMSEDDVPLGPGAGPYGNSAEQLNMAQGYPGGPQYGMYPQDPRLSGGMPGYDPYGVPLQPGMYPQQPQMPRSNRPMTLLEAQEMNHFNNQQMMGQAKFGPLIQLPEKKQHQPSGGLVGAINALQQQRAQTRYTNAHSRMQQSSSTTMLGQYADPQALAFEREKERVLQEQRMMALGGNASFMGGYSPYGPGGMMANGSAPQLAQGYPNPYGQQYSPMQHQLGSQDYFHPEGQYPPQFVGGFAPSGGYPQEDEDDDVAIGAIMQPAGANNILSPSSQGLGTSTLGSRSTVFQDPSSIKPTRINRNRPKSPVVNLDEYDSDEAPMQQVNTTARPYQSAYDPSPQGRDSEPEIEDDLMELFEDFSESKLQMRPYSYLRPADLYDVFRDWCDEESLDDDTIPNRRTFEYLMEQGGFVKKRRPAKMIQEQEERMGGKIKDAHEEWWYNIALVDD